MATSISVKQATADDAVPVNDQTHDRADVTNQSDRSVKGSDNKAPELDGSLESLIRAIRFHEARFDDYSAAVWTVRHFPLSFDNDPTMSTLATSTRMIVKDHRFHFVGDEVITFPNKTNKRHSNVVSNGTKTLAIEENNSATFYEGRVEPPMVIPPHSWGIFHLDVNFPLSVYLGGTEALKAHPKVGRHPLERGSIHEFPKVEAEIVREETIDDVACLVVRIQRWFYTIQPPQIQYLWIAKDRNLHVFQSRTAVLQDGKEIFQAESRVKKWQKMAPDVWLPKFVEVADITPAVANEKTTARVTQRLMLESAEFKPATAKDVFDLPTIPDALPVFAVDAQKRLVSDPQQPVAITGEQTTTLDVILNQLAEQEVKYNSFEIELHSRHERLNSHEGMKGYVSLNDHRTVISGEKISFEWTDYHYRAPLPNELLDDRQVKVDRVKVVSRVTQANYDGKVLQSSAIEVTATGVRNDATIQVQGGRPLNHIRPHCLIFTNYRPSETLSAFLKSKLNDDKNENVWHLSYQGDELIGDLVCHKLKCASPGTNRPVANDYFLIWLARDRNLIPIRHEWYEPSWNTSLPVSVSSATNLRQVRPNVWSPFSVSTFEFQRFSRDGFSANQLVLQARQEISVDSATTDPVISDHQFSALIVPEGTKISVFDNRGNHKKFTTKEEGPISIPKEQIEDGRNHPKDLGNE